MNDYFTKQEVYDILDESQNKIGTDVVTYRILKLIETKNLTVSDTYSVTVKHRIFVRGSDWQLGGNYQTNGFNNYPMMISLNSGITAISDSAAKIHLKKIFPKTINANVEQSSNQSTGSSSSQMNQNTSGSSSSNVNTFGVDVSFGFFGELPVGSVGFQYSHGWENSRSQSSTTGQSSGTDSQATSGNEMSVKDWSAYASVKNLDQTSQTFFGDYIQWNWGQTYPWNIFDYNETASGSNILLPEDVAARLLYYLAPDKEDPNGQNILLPPSDLSLFGLDFTMAAEWHITFPDKLTSIETVQFQHDVTVIRGSHAMSVPGGGGQASLITSLTSGYVNTMKQNTAMDIGEFALVPLLEGQRSGMGVGFQSNLFDIAPTSAATVFKIRSRGNDLLVTGQGFSSVMSAEFQKGYSGAGATLNIGFKVVDVTSRYALILKHWIGPGSGNIALVCNINGNQTMINVADLEGQGSANNLSQLELRNYDLKSPNFHDYLVLGWNEITIQISPVNPSVASEYIISALSLEA
ncbi:MAG: hypothetical protein JO080_13620 [Mucilaginibacter sp.]|nr:hypothetical protein [Mucilaginibacter sp.]